MRYDRDGLSPGQFARRRRASDLHVSRRFPHWTWTNSRSLCRTGLGLILVGVSLASCRGPARESPPPTGATRNLTASNVGTLYVIDVVGPVANPLNKVVHVLASEPVRVSGWAIDESAKALAGNVDVVLDGVPYAARYGVPRPDVAAYLKDAKYERSGYEYSIPVSQLPKGAHTVSIRVVMSDGKTYVQSPEVMVTVE